MFSTSSRRGPGTRRRVPGRQGRAGSHRLPPTFKRTRTGGRLRGLPRPAVVLVGRRGAARGRARGPAVADVADRLGGRPRGDRDREGPRRRGRRADDRRGRREAARARLCPALGAGARVRSRGAWPRRPCRSGLVPRSARSSPSPATRRSSSRSGGSIRSGARRRCTRARSSTSSRCVWRCGGGRRSWRRRATRSPWSVTSRSSITSARLWYCDLQLDAGASYFPFVRLALARYQPNSIAGEHLSRVVFPDFAQLVAERTATTRRAAVLRRSP